jgi:class 3 adenylate cyclase
MNPNTCTVCELMFTRVMRRRQIDVDVTVLFADLRGYTALSQTQSADNVHQVLDTFYDAAAEAIWEHDGLLNKTVGDAVMAIFNFPIRRENHTELAFRAATEIQRRCKAASIDFDVGIGIDTGETSFGEFGRAHRDLTAIGTVVNTAARAQSAASSGEILVTSAVRDKLPGQFGNAKPSLYELKGYAQPLELYSSRAIDRSQ